MKKLVRVLYSILVCAALLVAGIEDSDDSDIQVVDFYYKEPLSPIQNKDIEHPGNLSSLPSSCTLNQYATKLSIKHKTIDAQIQENNEPIDLSIHRSVGTKRPAQVMEESPPCKKRSISPEESNVNIDRLKKNLNVWNNARLCNRHRLSLHSAYRPAVSFGNIKNSSYKELVGVCHNASIDKHVRCCKALYSTMQTQNELLFTIASRSTYMHTKMTHFRTINANPSDYRFIEDLSGYYPGLPGDIIRYMDTHGPIISDQESIKTEWTETLGDIYVRKPAEPECAKEKKSIVYKSNDKYSLLTIAVQMILGLSEVHKDLSNLTAKFIEKTLKNKRDLNHLAVVKTLSEIVKKHKSSNKSNTDEQYAVLCNVLRDVLRQTCVSPESIAIQLYTEMYRSLAYFYKKAKMCEEILDRKKKKIKHRREYYLLAGKCIIKPQKCIKCTTTIDLNKKKVSEYKHKMEYEENKWSIPSNIHSHYHIHYIDNIKQQYTRVCMPMCSNEHVHTISQTIEYLKKIFSIEKEECICPYRRNLFGCWAYIEKENRNMTAEEFLDYEIVFYYIEEGLRDGYFTFAEFESYARPEGRAMRIPLFLSPLMRSAVSMGPFEEKNKIKHTVVDSMKSMWMQPSVYVYRHVYKTQKFSFVHHYYSNMHIRKDNADIPTIGCYIINNKTFISNGMATVEWYAKISNSVDEYTHCMLSNELVNDQDKYDKFIRAVKSQEYTPDSALYGFGLQNSVDNASGLELNDSGCSTNHSIDQKDSADFKLSVTPINNTSVNTKITDMQSRINMLDADLAQFKIKIKQSGTTEEQKKELNRKKQNIYTTKCIKRRKINKIQLQDQLLMKDQTNTASFPPCTFLCFRYSNTRTKSGLGAHNEILDAFTCWYNIH